MKTFLAVAVVAWSLTVACPAAARTWAVDPLGGGDAPTIAAAIDSAADGDVIALAGGVYRLAGNRDLDLAGKRITIHSQSDDPESCVIDCQGSFVEPHRGFIFHSGEDSLAVVRGLTIVNGCTREACPGCQGGAVYCTAGSSPTLEHCVFRDNVAATSGGGVFCDGGSSPRIRDCRFVDNQALSDSNAGGGLACGTGFQGSVERCEFTGNSAGNGGGLTVGASTIRLVDCHFSHNRAHTDGGAIEAQMCTLTMRGCTLAGNSGIFGGGVFVLHGTTVVENCTLAGNAGHFGAGCYGWDAVIGVVNTIIAFNEDGVAMGCEGVVDLAVSCTDIHGNEDGDWVDCLAGQAGENGNLAADPGFCDLAADDLTLFDTSPCLPEHNACGVQIGAHGQGCAATAVADGAPAVAGPSLTCRPNPFNPRTTIAYELPAAGQATLAAYDLRGRVVRALVSGQDAAGPHALAWDGRDDSGAALPSGPYLLRLEAGGQVESLRVMLLR